MKACSIRARATPARFSGAVLSRNPGLATAIPAAHGRCPHTGRAHRSRTEARWAAADPEEEQAIHDAEVPPPDTEEAF